MNALQKRIMVLFSGGDAAGMNPYLRALVRLGLNAHNATVLGVKDGFRGLVQLSDQVRDGKTTIVSLGEELETHRGLAGLWQRSQLVVQFDHAAVSGLAGRPGIVLGTGRSPEFHDPATRRRVIDLLKNFALDAVVVCGGNGSLAGATALTEEGDIPVVGVPATIDNDVAATEMALGVDTAVNTLVWAIQRFSDTAASHHRIMVLETMGRDSGELARLAALAVGAEIVVTPERGLLDADKMEGIASRLEGSFVRGRQHAIVLVSEGVKPADAGLGPAANVLAKSLQSFFKRPDSQFPDLEIRASVLGHLQRGGSPTAADRILAARYAQASWEAIASEPSQSGLLGLVEGRIGRHPFSELVVAHAGTEADKMYRLQKTISKW